MLKLKFKIMSKFAEKFIDVLDGMPTWVQVLGLFLIILLFGIIKFFSNPKTISALLNKVQSRVSKLTSKDLSNHRLFDKYDIYKSKISQLRFSSPVKTDVFQTILNAKLEIDLEMSKEFIDGNLDKIDKTGLCNKMISQVNCMISKYEEKSSIDLINKYGEDLGHELFNFVMDNPGGFREKRDVRTERIILQIDEHLRYSKIFDSNIERVSHFLTEVLFALRSAILDAEKMFMDTNGQIDKIINKHKK